MIRIIIAFIFLTQVFSCDIEPLEVDLENQFGALPKYVVSPENNLTTPQKIELGRLLFWDPILSGNMDVACATCHHPDFGYAENLDLSIGVGGEGLSDERNGGTLISRNAPTIINSAFNGITLYEDYNALNAPMFWDSRIQSLEGQSLMPIHSGDEMRGLSISEVDIMDTLVSRLDNNDVYKDLFDDAFGVGSISSEKIAQALASFERSIISNNSRFDQYANGDTEALNAQEIRGLIAFTEAGCNNCHSGPMFSDYKLHNLSTPENLKLDTPDLGDGEYAFRTPTLRNLSYTAPYMHNGIFATLDEVMTFYIDLQDESQNPNIQDNNLDELIALSNLNTGQVNSIIAFLKTLDDDSFDKEIPLVVPSGLEPGGKILR